MSRISVSQTIAATPAAVWSRIGDPARIHTWHPAFADVRSGDGTRTCILQDGAVIEERILSRDEAAMTYRYAITASPLPIREYVSELRVEPDGQGARVTWSSTFEALAEREAMEALLHGVYESGLGAVKAHFEG